jgi:pimeloyl-ACP methyl ester carboxylesterase
MILRLCIPLIIGCIANALPVAAFDIEARYETSQRHFALLFIHGLSGDANTSFARWPDVVRQDHVRVIDERYRTVRLSDFDIFLADYATRETGLSIVEIGQHFADQIEAEGSVFRQYDMVFIVAHSLGGLVLHEAFNVLGARNHLVYFRFIPAVLELGVPANGSVFADAAQALPKGVVEWLGYDPKLVKELQTGSDYLNALNKSWADMIAYRMKTDGWPIVFCGYETKVESAVAKAIGITEGKVVPPLYASNACSAGASLAIPRTHVDLPKVQNPTDDAHKLLRRMVSESLRTLETKRFVPGTQSLDLYDALSRIAAESVSDSAVDRDTGVRLYKEQIEFNDPQRATLSLQVGRVSGWSIDDAVWRAVGPYPCLATADNGKVLAVSVKPGVACR